MNVSQARIALAALIEWDNALENARRVSGWNPGEATGVEITDAADRLAITWSGLVTALTQGQEEIEL